MFSYTAVNYARHSSRNESNWFTLLYIVIAFPDTDECVQRLDNCNQNAVCMNTIGSFDCSCNDGFTGDGVTCTSRSPFLTSCIVPDMWFSQ